MKYRPVISVGSMRTRLNLSVGIQECSGSFSASSASAPSSSRARPRSTTLEAWLSSYLSTSKATSWFIVMPSSLLPSAVRNTSVWPSTA